MAIFVRVLCDFKTSLPPIFASARVFLIFQEMGEYQDYLLKSLKIIGGQRWN